MALVDDDEHLVERLDEQLFIEASEKNDELVDRELDEVDEVDVWLEVTILELFDEIEVVDFRVIYLELLSDMLVDDEVVVQLVEHRVAVEMVEILEVDEVPQRRIEVDDEVVDVLVAQLFVVVDELDASEYLY